MIPYDKYRADLADFRADIAQFREEVRADLAEFRSEIKDLRVELEDRQNKRPFQAPRRQGSARDVGGVLRAARQKKGDGAAPNAL